MDLGVYVYTVIYKFVVKENLEKAFQEAWRNGTKLIYKKLGSLGSRLQFSEKGEWLAYAVWPSKEQFEKPWDLSESENDLISKIRECCINAEVLYKLDVVDDLIKSNISD